MFATQKSTLAKLPAYKHTKTHQYTFVATNEIEVHSLYLAHRHGKLVRHFHESRGQRIQRLVNQTQKVLLRLLVGEVEAKLFFHFHQNLGQVGALGDVLDACEESTGQIVENCERRGETDVGRQAISITSIAHQTEQIENQVRRFSQPVVGLEENWIKKTNEFKSICLYSAQNQTHLTTESFEAGVIFSFFTTHGICHRTDKPKTQET